MKYMYTLHIYIRVWHMLIVEDATTSVTLYFVSKFNVE
jgi:hypothetical protein